jgi:hypothetical protein
MRPGRLHHRDAYRVNRARGIALAVGGEEAGAAADSGVGEDDIETSFARNEIINHGLQGAGVEHVDRLTLDRSAPLAQRRHHRLEPFGFLIEEEDLRAVVGERIGDAEAEARRPAGQRDFLARRPGR